MKPPRDQQIKELETKIRNLKNDVNNLQAVLKMRNEEINSLGKIWCAGGCSKITINKEDVTEEHVQYAKLYARRLEVWYANWNARKGIKPPSWLSFPAKFIWHFRKWAKK